MARSIFGGCKPVKLKAAAKAVSPPAIRNLAFEEMLCSAMKAGVTVNLRYQKPGEFPDQYDREFGPAALYYSEPDKVCVAGEEISNPNNAGTGRSPHIFEVGRIVQLSATSNPYELTRPIDFSQPRYSKGVICKR